MTSKCLPRMIILMISLGCLLFIFESFLSSRSNQSYSVLQYIKTTTKNSSVNHGVDSIEDMLRKYMESLTPEHRKALNTVTKYQLQYSELPSMVEDFEILTPLEEQHKDPTDIFRGGTTEANWLQKREDLISQSTQKKVLLFCYMRGGSSFFSEIFRQNPEVMYWYEPIDAFYSAVYGENTWHFPQDIFWYQNSRTNSFLRNLPTWETEALASYNHNLLSCNTSVLPTELLTHGGIPKSNFFSYQRCVLMKSHRKTLGSCRSRIERQCRGNIANAIKRNCSESIKEAYRFVSPYQNKYANVRDILASNSNVKLYDFIKYADCSNEYRRKYVNMCLPILKNKCQSSKMITYKGLRISMNSIEHMLQKDPDMFIVYFVRDPRSIVTSRVEIKHTYRVTRNNPVTEAALLCKKLLNDYKIYQNLNAKYPGAIKLVRYEDFTKNTHEAVGEIYNFLGMEVNEQVYKWINNSNKTNSTKTFGTKRKDGAASIDKWKTKNSKTVQTGMTEQCKDILTLLGYTL